jgi:hypothetical protein
MVKSIDVQKLSYKLVVLALLRLTAHYIKQYIHTPKLANLTNYVLRVKCFVFSSKVSRLVTVNQSTNDGHATRFSPSVIQKNANYD